MSAMFVVIEHLSHRWLTCCRMMKATMIMRGALLPQMKLVGMHPVFNCIDSFVSQTSRWFSSIRYVEIKILRLNPCFWTEALVRENKCSDWFERGVEAGAVCFVLSDFIIFIKVSQVNRQRCAPLKRNVCSTPVVSRRNMLMMTMSHHNHHLHHLLLLAPAQNRRNLRRIALKPIALLSLVGNNNIISLVFCFHSVRFSLTC